MVSNKKYSMLGKTYNAEYIICNEENHQNQLKRIRKLPENHKCADCESPFSNWASVNLGIFLCIQCAQVHRGLGSHISKIKSCMGTCYWYPDEIDNMKENGNIQSNLIYNPKCEIKRIPKINIKSSFEKRKKYITIKYS